MRHVALLLTTLALAGCGEHARLPLSAGIGPDPTLPAPTKTLFPTIDVADAKGWPSRMTPTAAPGLAFANGNTLGFGEGAFIGQHGSWNRSPPPGYKVIFVPFSGGRPSGPPVDILTGFRAGGVAYGRPVQVAIGAGGGLFVADDVGNTVWCVSGQVGTSTSSPRP